MRLRSLGAGAAAGVVAVQLLTPVPPPSAVILCDDARWTLTPGAPIPEQFYASGNSARDVEAWVERAQCLRDSCGDHETSLEMCILLIGDRFVRVLVDRQ